MRFIRRAQGLALHWAALAILAGYAALAHPGGVYCATQNLDLTREDQRHFFVAVDGNDANPGTHQAPFASIEAARDALRALKAEDTLHGPVTVWIRGGVYHRTETFRLSEEDSGTPDAPIAYRAYGTEAVSLVGGRALEASWFAPVTQPAVLARLEPAARNRVVQADLKAHGITDYGEMSQLGPMLDVFWNGRRMPLARYPNEGWMHIGKVVDEQAAPRLTDGNKQGKTFQYSGDRPARWVNAQEAALHGFWWFGWTDEHVKIDHIDTERREITLARVPGGGIRKDQWFCALNLLEEIDQPGEWFLDRATGVLYFWPPDGFEQHPLYCSTMTEPLLVFDSASYVCVRGITLEVTRGVCAVLGGGRHQRLAGCIVRDTGTEGIVMDHGNNTGVVGCDIYDIGSTGIRLSGGNRSTLEPSGNYVVNNHIHHYAQRKKVYHPAVRLYGCGHRVAHNLIHDAPHQAIGYDGNDHVIEFNEIHHVVLESADAGVLYTGCNWTWRGNVVRHNFIHHIPHGPGLGTVGVYLDDCCSSTEIFGNVFFDMLKPAFIGGGRDNVIANNIFIACDTPVHLDNRGLRWDHFRPGGPMYDQLKQVRHDQPPYSTRYPALARILDEVPQAPLGNVCVNNVAYKSSWRDPEAHCRETSDTHIDREYMRIENNYVTDKAPGFIDPDAMNFQLRDDAVVYEKIPAFKRIPFDKIGLYNDAYRVTWPAASHLGHGGAMISPDADLPSVKPH